MGANHTDREKRELEISVFNTHDLNLMYKFMAFGEIWDNRVAISDDGKLVATAIWSDYGKGHVYVYDCGTEVVHTREFNRIDWVKFEGNKLLMIGQRNSTYYLDVQSGEVVDRRKYYKCFNNPYGDEVFQKDYDIIIINKKRLKASTFAYIQIVIVEDGVVGTEVCNCAVKYDFNGNKLWETATKQYGHFIKMHYNAQTNQLYGITADRTGCKLFYIDIATGITQNVSLQKNEYGMMISDGEKDYIINYDGDRFEILEDGLEKVDEIIV